MSETFEGNATKWTMQMDQDGGPTFGGKATRTIYAFGNKDTSAKRKYFVVVTDRINVTKKGCLMSCCGTSIVTQETKEQMAEWQGAYDTYGQPHSEMEKGHANGKFARGEAWIKDHTFELDSMNMPKVTKAELLEACTQGDQGLRKISNLPVKDEQTLFTVDVKETYEASMFEVLGM